ncbi:MAG: hypothetical protein KHZ72_01790 [Lachnospiraceae bacterium]|nr:hypothetical protein [Lachnospiraceae bacterium]
MSEFYKFFSHKKCEYFPCHKTDDPDKGVKDCSQCMFPHERKNYEKMMEKLRQK